MFKVFNVIWTSLGFNKIPCLLLPFVKLRCFLLSPFEIFFGYPALVLRVMKKTLSNLDIWKIVCMLSQMSIEVKYADKMIIPLYIFKVSIFDSARGVIFYAFSRFCPFTAKLSVLGYKFLFRLLIYSSSPSKWAINRPRTIRLKICL